MCVLIYDGDVEIQSPKQLEDHFPQITKMIPAEGTDKDPLLAIKILDKSIKKK